MSEKNSLETDRSQLVRPTWVLAIVTILLFIIGGLSMMYTKKYMSEEVTELRRATELQWRPFLNISIDSVELGVGYDLSNSDTIAIRSLDSIRIRSDAYLAVKRFLVEPSTSYDLYNSGATPLRLIRMRKKGISEKEWTDKYSKSCVKLKRDIEKRDDFDSLETDVIILPDSTFHSKFGVTGLVKIPIDEYEHSIFENKRFIFYTYIYIEYKDFLDNDYNAIYIMHHTALIDTINGTPEFSHMVNGLEQYRWDFDLR
jgi:hypothetical protein